MAVSAQSSADQLKPGLARVAGAASAVYGAAVAAAACLRASQLWRYARTAETLEAIPAWLSPGAAVALHVLLAGLGAIVFVAGVELVRRRAWAQRFLLTVLLIGLAGALPLLLGGLMRKLDTIPAGPDAGWVWIALAVSIVAQLILVLLLIRCARSSSRLRYGSIVLASVVAAVGVAVVVNFIAQEDYWRKNVEVLGRYGLSDRTRTILDGAESNIRLTVMYTSTREGQEASEYRPRVWELATEMREHSPNVEVYNAVTDAEKAAVLDRLRHESGGRADEHVALLRDFQTRSEALTASLAERAETFSSLPADSYLAQWHLGPEVVRVLTLVGEQTRQQGTAVARELSGGGLPDYAELVDGVRKELESSRDSLRQARGVVAEIAAIPEAVSANRQRVLASVKSWTAACRATLDALGQPGEEIGDGPAARLRSFADACEQAAARSIEAARVLRAAAGEGNERYLQASSHWMVDRTPVGDVIAGLAAVLQRDQADARQLAEDLTPEALTRTVLQFRKQLQTLQPLFGQVDETVRAAVDELSTVDETTAELFRQVRAGELFAEPLGIVDALLERIDALPELEPGSVATDITGENIVVVEAGGAVEVVDFDAVWPEKVSAAVPEGGEPTPRIFDGEAAVSTAILSLTRPEPFATVYLTYFRPDLPPQMQQMAPQSDIPPEYLTGLRARLEAANFAVEEWNLVDDLPAPAVDDATQPTTDTTRPAGPAAPPRVLLILPPPPPAPPNPYGPQQPMPSFGPEHVQKIRDAIDDGIPTVFLAKHLRRVFLGWTEMPQQYALNDVLRDDWGVEALTDYRLVAGVPDQEQPGRYRIDVLKFSFLALNRFTDHEIARPLQARRVLWTDVCLLDVLPDAPEGVSVEPLLEVPAAENTVWATDEIRRLVLQISLQQEGYVTPDFAGGDVAPPMTLAVAATRAGDPQRGVEPSRMVALGVSGGLMDGYLNEPVPQLDGSGGIRFTDPPRTNADLVVNSVYWLIGQNQYIAAGPVRAEPIAQIEPETLWGLRAAVLVGLPAAILILGGIVMVLRRR